MSGWLLLAAILVAAAIGWLIYVNSSLAAGRRDRRRDGRHEATGAVEIETEVEGEEGEARRDRPTGGLRRGRWFRVREAVADTEVSAETFVPPEVREPGAREQEPPEEEAGAPPEAVRTRARREPLAVPTWEHPIPWSYGKTHLVAMVRDPYWIFAYWELTAEVHRAAEEQVGREAWTHARPVIRVYDVTGGSYYDVAVNEEARSWHLNVGQPDRTWYLEIGRLTEAGEFIMLARSNTVHTPRDMPSDVIDGRWPPLLREEGFWPEGMPTSPGPAASPGMPGSAFGGAPERGS
jgi:hypothetical protein